MSLGKAAEAARAGASFAMFEQEARSELGAIARGAWKRRPVPPGVDREDVYQEVLLAAHLALKSWDGRGSLEAYVAWRARNAAADWTNKQRGALRRSSRAPSRFPANLSTLLPAEAPPEAADALMPKTEATQERTAELAREVDRASARLGTRDRFLLSMLVGEGLSAEAVASRIQRDPNLRRRLCVSAAAAQQLVTSMIQRAWPDA